MHLYPPAYEVAGHKDIHFLHEVSKGTIGVAWCVHSTVSGVVLLLQWSTETRINQP